ncbi:PstS family phosphate ABC transporter substrate-binding protein [Sebaldella sp. S0638]|uniref:PstS family phosphate ABC transporter substrate-binding protein n=1 Tax=Sebaldella sp. S0638 TaxID=2957809 RepID=UPI00209F1526|nr:PstS family phosphate ABC transporter substrate-binding protein [Sebaldella sp. S0638]MCP1223638.1 PstS family phosphate ABC transporter substrate-binding protein [Sebaldella sp. S0638]
MKKMFALMLISLGLLVSCGGGKDGGSSSGLSGEVIIDGSSTVAPITEAVAEEFREVEPDVNVSVGISGTGGGFKKFTVGELDISNASREMKPEEKALAEKNKIEFTEIQVGKDGITMVVNKENTWAQDITTDELKKIWSDGSTVKTWKDIRPEWPDTPIKLYAPDEDSGTYDYFIEAILGNGKIRKDYTPSSDDNVLVQGVEGDKGSLGFFGFAYYEENADKLTALKVNGVEPTPETVQNGTYKPLSRPIFIFINNKSYAEKPQVKTFVEFYLDKVADLAREVGYIPLDDYSAEKAKLK